MGRRIICLVFVLSVLSKTGVAFAVENHDAEPVRPEITCSGDFTQMELLIVKEGVSTEYSLNQRMLNELSHENSNHTARAFTFRKDLNPEFCRILYAINHNIKPEHITGIPPERGTVPRDFRFGVIISNELGERHEIYIEEPIINSIVFGLFDNEIVKFSKALPSSIRQITERFAPGWQKSDE